MRFTNAVIVLLTGVFLTSCTQDSVQPSHPVNESNNGFESYAVAEIFAVNCTESECHGGSEPQHALSLENWNGLVHGSFGRPTSDSSHHHKFSKTYHGETPYGGGPVIPFNADKSLLYRLIIGDVQDHSLSMPYGKSKIPQSQIDVIKDWINRGAKSNSGEIPYTHSDKKIYLCAQGSDEVYIVDPDHKAVSGIIDVDFLKSVNDQPHNIQIKNGYVYVTLITTGRFIKYDLNTHEMSGFVEGLEAPGMINISPDGKKAYVSKSSTAPGDYNIIYVVDTQTMTREADIVLPVFGLPHAIALSNDGSTLYVANMTKDRISIMNTVTGDPISDIVLSSGSALVHEPMHIYLSPDNQYLYVNCRKSSKMLIIETQTNTVVKEFDIKEHPMQAAISSDGNKIFVVSHHDPYITEITKSGTSWTITNEFESPLFHHLYGADLSGDDRYLYVTCSNSTDDFKSRYQNSGQTRAALLCIYDTQTHEIVRVLDTGSYATGIAAR
ncbi:MAG: hypothetical protein IPM56_06820 [Ignavibacteriales bacterium]|nr:MAG: hypothetical protein IPM56_06820 [Ignavibacteriales bacterium]